jgi:hypothetical protein
VVAGLAHLPLAVGQQQFNINIEALGHSLDAGLALQIGETRSPVQSETQAYYPFTPPTVRPETM